MDYGFYLLNVDGVAKSVQAYKAALVVSLRLDNVSVYFHVYTRAVTFTVIIQRRQFNLLLRPMVNVWIAVCHSFWTNLKSYYIKIGVPWKAHLNP